MKKLLLASLLALPVLASASVEVEPVNLLTNGSFEVAAQADRTWAIQAVVPGWNVGPGLELRNNVEGTAQDGGTFAELDGNYNNWISQTFATVVGQAYDLSFFTSNRTGTAASTNGLSYSLNGSGWMGAPILAANNTGDNVWSKVNYSFIADAAFTTLSFMATGTSDSFGSSLDNVSVTAVPEPGTYALMIGGLAAVGFIARRRRNETAA